MNYQMFNMPAANVEITRINFAESDKKHGKDKARLDVLYKGEARGFKWLKYREPHEDHI